MSSVISQCLVAKPKRVSTAEAMNILLDPNLDNDRVCTRQPISVEPNRLFVVDLRCLEKPKDVMCDDMGSWVSNRDYTAWVVVDEDGAVDTVKSLTKPATEGMYFVCRKYYTLKGCPDFHRMVFFVEGTCMDDCVCVYVCACINVCVCMHVHVFVHVCMLCVCVHMCVCMHVCICVCRVCVCVCVCLSGDT